MFEDFRKQILDDSFKDEDQKKETPGAIPGETRYFLGLKPVQRFIVAFLLLVMIVALGVLFLLVTSKIVPPV